MSKELLDLIPTIQSVSLVTNRYNSLKKRKKNLIGNFTEDIVGIELIKATRKSI